MNKYILILFFLLIASYNIQAEDLQDPNKENLFTKNNAVYPDPENITIKVNKKDFSETEIRILQDLEAKRIELDRKAQLLMVREKLLDISENKLIDKIDKLKQLEKEIKELLIRVSEKEEKRLKDLSIVYAKMKPSLAAERLNALENRTVYEILKRMNHKDSAKILEKMNVRKVKIISEMLAEKTRLPKIKK